MVFGHILTPNALIWCWPAVGSFFDIDLSDCDNNLEVNLLQSPQGDICIPNQVIIYDPALSGLDAVWSNGDVTTTVQNTFSENTPNTYNYAVTVTDDNTGCTGTDNINVTFVE